jgi:hypothetical protein
MITRKDTKENEGYEGTLTKERSPKTFVLFVVCVVKPSGVEGEES